MNNHDYLVIGLILVILLVQVLVFFSVFRRIQLYRGIFPDVKNFRTIKVCIPTDRIADITPEEIIANLPVYAKDIHVEDPVTLETDKSLDQERIATLDVDSDSDASTNVSYESGESEVWMCYRNEEKKVPVAEVDEYLVAGWRVIAAGDNDNG